VQSTEGTENSSRGYRRLPDGELVAGLAGAREMPAPVALRGSRTADLGTGDDFAGSASSPTLRAPSGPSLTP